MTLKPAFTFIWILSAPAILGAQAPSGKPVPERDTTSPQALDTVAVREKQRTRLRYTPRLNSSALKTPALLRDVPQSVSIVTNALMKDQAMQSMGDVARYMPGLTSGQGEGNRDQLVIRGNASTADFFVDGVRDDVQYYRDVYNVDHVEALKGSNAMVFGRGGGGGVLNRVSKHAGATPVRELTAEGGMHGHARLTTDVNSAPSPFVAARLSSLYQESNSFRRGVNYERYGMTPTVTLGGGGNRASLILSYEHFQDHRTADRGIPSLAGRPFETPRETFFGDPSKSRSDARVNSASATLSTRPGSRVNFTNRTRLAKYDKFYSNVFSGALNAAGTQVAISAYDNDTRRTNLFNQSDLVVSALTGRVRHALLFGAEIGRQTTSNLRRTGYFNGTTPSHTAASTSPTIRVPIEFRAAPGDADNGTENSVVSIYGQDHMELSRYLQVVGGVRYERFDIDFHNNRDGKSLSRRDGMISPRAGLVFKPRESLSLYNSYSVSYLPSSGDQFSSLTDITRALEPERFTNVEVGAKWEPVESMALSGAVYRLDRTNTRSNDPVDPARIVQSGKQRTSGYEVELRGSLSANWDVIGGYSNQSAFILNATTVAAAGKRVPLVPRNVASLWNRFSVTPRFAIGAGIVHQSASFATIDNLVTLPGFTKADAALYYRIARGMRMQMNVENLFDARYYPHANNNNNISVGAPRTVKLSLTAGL